MLVEDGKGRGTRAAVDTKNRLDVHAENEDRREAFDTGKVWSLSFDGIDPVGADDYFVHLNNTGSETYIITDIRISSTVAGYVEVHKVSGTASYTAGASLDITSRNLGSSITPTGTYYSDTDTTGLTNEGVLFFLKLEANVHHHTRTTSSIILSPGTQLALLWDTSTGVLSGTISMVNSLSAEER